MAESVVKKEQQQVATLDLSLVEADADLGNENVTSETLSIPFLKTDLSEAIRAANRGSVMGDMYNTVTGQIYDGEKGIKVISCHFERRFIHWSDINDETSKAPKAIYKRVEDCPPHERDPVKNIDYLKDGSGDYIEDTNQHYCLVLEKDESGKHTTASPVLIAMKRTSLKASRKWNTFIKTRHKVTADGKSITPPRFYWIWDLCTYKENKGGRDYYVWDAKLSDEAEVTDMNIYMQAKAFYDSIKGDAIDVKYEQDAPQAEAPKPATPPKAESKGGQGNMPF